MGQAAERGFGLRFPCINELGLSNDGTCSHRELVCLGIP